MKMNYQKLAYLLLPDALPPGFTFPRRVMVKLTDVKIDTRRRQSPQDFMTRLHVEVPRASGGRS